MIIQSIAQSIIQPVVRSVIDPLRISPPFLLAPLALFLAGEQGLWYDPSDLSSLFQDAAGTTPVTAAGQPVGLMLDKRLGLIPSGELVINGDFSQGAAGWTLGSGWSIGSGVASKAAGVNADLTSSLAAVVGKTYNITYTATVTAGNMSFRIGSTTGPVHAMSGTFTAYLTATTTSPLAVNGNSAFVGTVDNISVRELPGNHAKQPTAASKLILRDAPWRFDFDGIDDSIVTTFPVSLGTACTVARSIPGSGAQILTAQTIGTSFTDSTDSCSLVIIDRALTAGETASLTTYLNKAAGL